MEARKGRAKIRSEPLPPSSPPSPFQHRDTDINYRSARNGAFFQACGEVAAVLPLPPRSLPSKRSKHARGVVGSSDRFSCELRPTDKSARPLLLLFSSVHA